MSSANTAITVGQTVTGTNVAPLTTVAAISTTALTLSTTPSAAITAGTTLTFNENNVNFIESGQTVINAGWSSNTTVSSISANILTVDDSVSTGGDRVIIFASDDIKCNYIAKPTIVNWGYTEINGSALYNSASSTDFQLHDSEESKLTYKILSLAGINLGGDLYTIGSQEENKKIQQEKQ